MKDVRRLPYRSAPGLVPQELIGKCFKCPKCNSDVQVPWLEKMEFPRQPIQPISEDGHWVPVSFPLACNACSYDFDARVATLADESKWLLYGDEAGRYINDPLVKYSQKPLNFFALHWLECIRAKRTGLKKESIILNVKSLLILILKHGAIISQKYGHQGRIQGNTP